MQKINFELDGDYIELIGLLKTLGLAQTGGHAKALVENEEVLVNGTTELRKRYKVRQGDQIQLEDIQITVV